MSNVENVKVANQSNEPTTDRAKSHLSELIDHETKQKIFDVSMENAREKQKEQPKK